MYPIIHTIFIIMLAKLIKDVRKMSVRMDAEQEAEN